MRAIRCSSELPCFVERTVPSTLNTVKPRLPPSRSPSLAVTNWVREIQATPSGSRSRLAWVWVNLTWLGRSSVRSTLSRLTVPALKCLVTLPEARSTSAMWLFSCSVTTATLSSLMSTYSGSGSDGDNVAMPVRSTLRVFQVPGAPATSTMTRQPAGSCGGAPCADDPRRARSRSRRRRSLPSGLTATESGWPGKAIVAHGLARREVDDHQLAGGVHEARPTCSTATSAWSPSDVDRSRLAAHRQRAERPAARSTVA